MIASLRSIAFAFVVVATVAGPAIAGDAARPGETSGGAAPAQTGLELVPATAADILAAVRKPGSSATIVNLWATWCVPCRQEFPDLMRFWRAHKDKGVALVLVSGDFESETEAARAFLASQGVDFRTYRKSQKDQEFIEAFDPAWSGALPATFVYDAGGQRKHSFLGPITYESLEKEVAPLSAAKP